MSQYPVILGAAEEQSTAHTQIQMVTAATFVKICIFQIQLIKNYIKNERVCFL